MSDLNIIYKFDAKFKHVLPTYFLPLLQKKFTFFIGLYWF